MLKMKKKLAKFSRGVSPEDALDSRSKAWQAVEKIMTEIGNNRSSFSIT